LRRLSGRFFHVWRSVASASLLHFVQKIRISCERRTSGAKAIVAPCLRNRELQKRKTNDFKPEEFAQ